MAVSKKDIVANYPLPAYNYRVQIGSESYGFAKVSGLSVKYNTVSYRHGLSFAEGTHHLLGILQPVNLSLQKGVVRQGSLLLEWISRPIQQDITVDLCDENGTPQVSWWVQKALPTAYEAGDFDVNTQEVAIETLSLVSDNMRVTYHQSGQTGGGRGNIYSDLF